MPADVRIRTRSAAQGFPKAQTGYGLEFNANGTAKITEDYRTRELKASFFGRSWNEDNVPIEPGPGGSGCFLWQAEFQNDDFLLSHGANANRRYKINIYPFTEGGEVKMFLNGKEFVRQPQEGSAVVTASDPLDLPIRNKAIPLDALKIQRNGWLGRGLIINTQSVA